MSMPRSPALGGGPGGTGGGGDFDIMKYLGPILGGSMFGQGIFGLFGGGNKNPYDVARPYYDKMMQQLPGYFEPWTTAGRQALPTLQEQYGQLIGNPQDIYNKLAGGYKESPGYQFRQQQGQGAALNQAAAGGMAGTPMAQQNAAQISEDIANQDFMQYLQSMMGLYGMGMGGLSDISKQGLGGSMALGQDMSSIMSRMAEEAARGQQYQQQGEQTNWGNIAGGLASLAPYILPLLGL